MKAKSNIVTVLLIFAVFSGLAFYFFKKPAHPVITVAYQPIVEPSKVAQADGLYEKALGQDINWRRFESGAEVIAAMKSGTAPIGYVGSVALATAASSGVELEAFFIALVIGQSEALVVRNDAQINQAADLVGKKIAVPFGSTSHFSLLAAFKHWDLDPDQSQIINMRISEMGAAWERAEMDAAYVWEPTLSKAKATGKVLVSTEEVAKWSSPTYDLWVVRKDFAQTHPDVVRQFFKVTAKQVTLYNANPKAYSSDSRNIEKIARLTGAKPSEVALQLAGNTYPALTEQETLLQQPLAKALASTATFLKFQGGIEMLLPALLPDYAVFTTHRFAQHESP